MNNPTKKYYLQNRYQDSGWENLYQDANTLEEFDDEHDACWYASKLSLNSICYGMVRVIDSEKNKVVITFPAGVYCEEE